MPENPAMPLEGRLITLTGGGGFIGRYAAQALMQAGARVRVVQRRPDRAYALRALGNLGQLQLVAADALRPGAIARAIVGSDAVVNFIAGFRGNLDRVNVATSAHIAAGAAETGAAMVQISAIGARADSPSAYGRSKAAAEAAVRAAVPQATILRPSVVFGQEDQFINRFASMIRMSPVVPLIAPETRFQPVFVGDVAAAVTAALADCPAHEGRTYQLGGPAVMSMRQVFAWIAAEIGHDPFFVDVPDAIASTAARATGWIPGAPLTRDQMLMLGEDNVVAADAQGLSALGCAPTTLDAVSKGWLDIYRRNGRFSMLARAA